MKLAYTSGENLHFKLGNFGVEMKKVFGMKNKKKADDSDEESASYTDPAIIHATDPPARNSKGISHPHYPPPRPCHSGNSPNPRRKNQDTMPVQGNKKAQLTDTNRNSFPGQVTTEPKRAPPRANIAKKLSDAEGDYCDPIDVQRKDDFIQGMTSKPIKDDYCEPWDSTIKTDATNVASKRQSNSDDENNEYLDPYDTGREGIIEQRMSRAIGREFGVQHGRVLVNEQRRSAIDVDPKNPAFDASKPPSDDYDMPWEWRQKMQQSKIRIPPPAAKPAGTSGDYDEPWEKKQSYLLKTQVPTPSGKPRSPVPLPRQNPPPNNDGQLYELPWDAMNQPNSQKPQPDVVYETPWDATGGGVANGGRASPRRFSQPVMPIDSSIGNNRKLSQPVIPSAPLSNDDYDMPWEYKNKQQFGMMAPQKPARLHEIADSQEINPDVPLDRQSWYHGPLTRQQAEESLRSALDCSFLVRNSESSKKDYSLSMKNNENFLHLKIVRQLDGQFILGQFSKPFMDIPKVIYHYSKNKLNIRGAEHKYLKHPVCTQPEYHTIEPEDDDGIAL